MTRDTDTPQACAGPAGGGVPEGSTGSPVLDALPAHVALLDVKGTILAVNRAWRRFAQGNLLRDEAAGVGLNYLDVCERSVFAGVWEARSISTGIRDVLAGHREQFEEEYPCHSPTAHQWFRVMVTRIPGEGPARAVVMHLDVTERHEAEAALRQSEDEYRALIEGSIQGVCIHRDAVILMANPALARIFGYGPSELVGRHVGALVAPHELARILPYGPARLQGEPVPERYEFEGVRRDGTLIWLEAMVSVVTWRGAPAILATFVDISDRKRAEEALRVSEEQLGQAQRLEAIGRLAGGVAHDFNNLLTVIIGRSELLANALGPDDPRRRQVELIERTATRASRLTQQLLAFGRKQVLQPTVVDVHVVVDEISSVLRALIGSEVGLDIVRDARSAAVQVDRAQLEQAIVNLVTNARDALPSQGQITISTTNVTFETPWGHGATCPPGTYLVLAVTDTGHGMPPEVAARAFDPFFTTKGRDGRTGLGLSMVYGFVKQSGGEVTVESQPGMGTVVRVYLPSVGA